MRWLDGVTTTQEEEHSNKRIQRRFAGATRRGYWVWSRVEEEKKTAAKALKEADANSQDNSKHSRKGNGSANGKSKSSRKNSGKGTGKGKRKATGEDNNGVDEEASAKHSEVSKAHGFEAMQFSSQMPT